MAYIYIYTLFIYLFLKNNCEGFWHKEMKEIFLYTGWMSFHLSVVSIELTYEMDELYWSNVCGSSWLKGGGFLVVVKPY